MDDSVKGGGIAGLNSIVVVAICSGPQLRRSLMSLLSQAGFSTCETIVAADPRIGSLRELAKEFPEVRFFSQGGCDTPVDLAAMALTHARGEKVIFTEDSCVASPGWLSALLHEFSAGRGAVGGAVEPMSGMSLSMWAFCFVDFFRYMHPLREGPSPTLSVCNIAYRRSDLDELSARWSNGFNEHEINSLLKSTGPLWLSPEAQVRFSRDVRLPGAIRERYAFGRLLGATRVADGSARRRAYYAAFAPAVPFILIGRMLTKAFRDVRMLERFVITSPLIVTFVLAWSWGEWLGYLTGRRSKNMSTAPERYLSNDKPADQGDKVNRVGHEWS